MTRPGDKLLTTKKSAINFSRIRANHKLEFTVQARISKPFWSINPAIQL